MAQLGVVITGGAGDIGAASAAELKSRGARVTLLDSKSETEARPWLDRLGDGVDFVTADVRDRTRLTETLEAIDPLDVAIANAGIVQTAPFLEITEEQWNEQLAVNLTGAFFFAQAAARVMAARGRGGRIIFTGSWVGSVAWPEIAAYSVTKAGVQMLAKSMAAELARERILVNVLAPGIVRAGLSAHQLEIDPGYAARVAKAIPLRELQTAEQVAKVMAFLCSPEADYLTGTVILADGGCSLLNFDE